MPTSTFIVSASRTPFSAFGASLKNFTATQLAIHSSNSALSLLPPSTPIHSVIMGNVLQTSKDAAYLARHVALHCNLPISTAAYNVNRLCGSGFQSVMNAVQEIETGQSEIVLAGGTESMSQSPFVLRDARWGVKYGKKLELEDFMAESLVDSFANVGMGITAENLAEKYGISREECDKYALLSQRRWKNALDKGLFDMEIAPIKVKGRKGEETIRVDEGPRPDATLEGLAKLKPVFKKDGVVTAGNASGITDGAASVIVASENAVKKYGLKPLARIVSFHVEGVAPEIMGIGPVPAVRGALKKAGKRLSDMNVIELNEAFAAQTLAVLKELGIGQEKVNECGGAIALGHPLGASGARIVGHVVKRLVTENKQWGIGTACIGGGQGIAIVFEKA